MCACVQQRSISTALQELSEQVQKSSSSGKKVSEGQNAEDFAHPVLGGLLQNDYLPRKPTEEEMGASLPQLLEKTGSCVTQVRWHLTL